jgi:cytidyltransferase-like protein
MSKVITSGYFIWLHVGHAELFEKASKLGSSLTVILNNDAQQVLKYGKVIVPYKERKKVLESILWIDEVVESIDDDRTVCKSLKFYKPDIFAKGGDWNNVETPEEDLCRELNIKVVKGLGEKIQSSSNLLKNAETII